MMKAVAERGRYFYDYREYMVTVLLASICCCFTSRCKSWFDYKVKRMERYQEASNRLTDETDIVKLLYILRLNQFIATSSMKRY